MIMVLNYHNKYGTSVPKINTPLHHIFNFRSHFWNFSDMDRGEVSLTLETIRQIDIFSLPLIWVDYSNNTSYLYSVRIVTRITDLVSFVNYFTMNF